MAHLADHVDRRLAQHAACEHVASEVAVKFKPISPRRTPGCPSVSGSRVLLWSRCSISLSFVTHCDLVGTPTSYDVVEMSAACFCCSVAVEDDVDVAVIM